MGATDRFALSSSWGVLVLFGAIGLIVFYLFDRFLGLEHTNLENNSQSYLPTLKQAGKTAIVISHEDRYFYIADRTIKLDYGKIEFDRQS